MVFGYLLLVFIPLAAVAYVIWDHQRKAAQRLAASSRPAAEPPWHVRAGGAAERPDKCRSRVRGGCFNSSGRERLRHRSGLRHAAIALDFVVSDRRMSPVAVVMLKLPGSSSSGLAEGANLVPAWLATAGVRYVELDAAALPRKDAMREVVLGPAAAPESAQAPSSVAG